MTVQADKMATPAAREVEQKLNAISGGKVLDVCTYEGDFIHTLMKMLKDYNSFVGVDISKKDLKSARKDFIEQPVKFKEMNAEALEFDDESFDTVCISHSLHHLKEIEKVLGEMKRALRPEGYFILQEMYCDGQQSDAQQTDILAHHWSAKVDAVLGIPHYETLTMKRLREIVTALGLKELQAIETTHPIKCLFCDNRAECADPKHENVITFAISEIDRTLNRLQEYLDQNNPTPFEDSKKLKEEGEMLKALIRENGSASASQIFFIGRK
ncbi:MAG: class I SAM-dependent methyltransferase [Candidatus Hodarchaeales archaeon]|jgi:ubiquinone/menaquinone biosynthesis C-methylase UbiE